MFHQRGVLSVEYRRGSLYALDGNAAEPASPPGALERHKITSSSAGDQASTRKSECVQRISA